MGGERGTYPLAALEHLTGPSRGATVWLRGAILDVYQNDDRLLRISEVRPGEAAGDTANGVVGAPLALLHHSGDTYEITALEGRPVWVNGSVITTQKLAHRDMIEFGDTGPLTRFLLYPDDRPARKSVSDILLDGLAYLRVSRQPVAARLVRAFGGLVSRLARETTLLFRIGVIAILGVLVALAYQQHRLNELLEQRIDIGAARLESFSGALEQSRKESLTLSDLKALKQELGGQLSSNADRLVVLERRTEANARVIAGSTPSVVFVQGAYGFQDRSSHRMLRQAVNDDGQTLVSPLGQQLLTLAGEGPVVERQFTGTAFAVGEEGVLVTNRHVALPWVNDGNVEALESEGLEPVMIKYIVYLPNSETPYNADLVRVSDEADLAVVRLVDVSEPVPGLELAEQAPVPGDEVIVMGYPTGLRAMLAQSGEAFLKELQEIEDIGFWTVAARLAAKGHIAPLSSRGIVSQVTPGAIIYDAETTHGGSGGPVLDVNGRVVAINAAIVPEYGGSNMGVPIIKLRALLEDAGLN